MEGIVVQPRPGFPEFPEPGHLPALLDHLLDLGPVNRPLELVLEGADRQLAALDADEGLLEDVLVPPVLLHDVRNGLEGNKALNYLGNTLACSFFTLTGTSQYMMK